MPEVDGNGNDGGKAYDDRVVEVPLSDPDCDGVDDENEERLKDFPDEKGGAAGSGNYHCSRPVALPEGFYMFLAVPCDLIGVDQVVDVGQVVVGDCGEVPLFDLIIVFQEPIYEKYCLGEINIIYVNSPFLLLDYREGFIVVRDVEVRRLAQNRKIVIESFSDPGVPIAQKKRDSEGESRSHAEKKEFP